MSPANERQRFSSGKPDRSVPPATPELLPPSAGSASVAARKVWWSAALIVIATLGVYANSLSVGFLFDDFYDILDNPWVHDCWPPWRCAARLDGDHFLFHSRPVVLASFGVNFWLAEQTPWSYHAVNAVIHLVAALALFGLARQTLLLVSDGTLRAKATPLALVIALVWAVHPLNTQAVTYAVQRFESMMGMFYLLSAYAAARFMTTGRTRWGAAALAACLLAMGSKEVAFTIPVVLLCYDRAFVAGSFGAALRARPKFYAGLIACWLAYAPLYLISSGRGFAGATARVTWFQYARTQPGVILHYLRLCFWPIGQCLDYSWPVANTLDEILPPLVVIGALLGLTAWGTAKNWPAGFLGVWFFVILSVTSSVMPISDLAFEHRMYLSLAAVVALVVLGAFRLGDYWAVRHPQPARRLFWTPTAVAILAVLAMGAQTALRNDLYRSPIDLYRDTVAQSPNGVRGWMNLAVWCMRNTKDDPTYRDQALDAVNQALELDPQVIGAHDIRALVYESQGRRDDADREFALEERLHPNRHSFYMNRAMCLFIRGDFAAAVADYMKAGQLNPNSVWAIGDCALAWHRLGNEPAAIAVCDQALLLDPRNARIHWCRGAARAALGDYRSAIEDYNLAARYRPQMVETYRDRAAAHRALQETALAAEDEQRFAALGGQAAAAPNGLLEDDSVDR